MTRECAAIRGQISPPIVRQLVGDEPLPWPAVVVIDTRPDGVFLVRYAEDGQFAGDTWHPTVDEARSQASYEFGTTLGDWTSVPADVADLAGYALGEARTRD